MRVPKGYKAKVIDGETLYRRSSTPLGTRFPTEVCMTVAQYEDQCDKAMDCGTDR